MRRPERFGLRFFATALTDQSPTFVRAARARRQWPFGDESRCVDLHINSQYCWLMQRSTALNHLPVLLDDLTRRARAVGLTDAAWAARAGMPKETLSRLRRRSTCDFSSLRSLAAAVGAKLAVVDTNAVSAGQQSPSRHTVASVDRDYEERLVGLCVSRHPDVSHWASFGPGFFMAGLAVMLASTREFDRGTHLALAEQLHPGASEPEVFDRWLAVSPVRPSRFLPLVLAQLAHAA